MTSLRVLGLTKRFGTITAAYEVSFAVPSGRALALLGLPGSGKTSILRCVAGLDTPDWGSIEIGDEVVFDRSNAIAVPPERRALGVVFRSHGIWPHMTVAQNVAFPLKMRGVAPAEQAGRVSRMLETVGLKGFEDRPSSLLSGAQRLRAALARALVHDPRLVLFDEPLSDLDTQTRRLLRVELRLLQERLGFTAIYVTGDRAEAFCLADDVILMNQGAIELRGPPREVYRQPRTAFAARFFGMNVLEGRFLGPAADTRYQEVELSARLVVRGTAAPDVEFPEGGRVLACIRKDAVRVSRPRSPEEAQGTIVNATFLGEEEEYLIDIAGVRIEAIGPPAGLVKGDRIRVTMTPADWIFAR